MRLPKIVVGKIATERFIFEINFTAVIDSNNEFKGKFCILTILLGA
jgi:hypothetical protein